MKDFVIGFLFAILYSYLVLPKKQKGKPLIDITLYPILWNGMILIPLTKTKALHIHHWLIFLIISSLHTIINFSNKLFGFSFGLFLQGLRYKDFMIFINKNPWN
jgi:hypothetical protein